ncbi:esterase [Endozoicomonas sp. Mp262]|uniref:YqiA/YcfP family alpha/beta fold hydrolase n=1 Tax=Endozoicomonas sp. Mp262 TaxID=2919499 RepID=UPI0021D9F6AC
MPDKSCTIPVQGDGIESMSGFCDNLSPTGNTTRELSREKRLYIKSPKKIPATISEANNRAQGMNKKPLLIYLHGLNSAPQSTKAQLVKDYIDSNRLDIEYWIPRLPHWPEEIRSLILDTLLPQIHLRPVYIIGSSLGGFLGTWLQDHIYRVTETICPKLVLINPAARPFELFENYLGTQENLYTGERWELTINHVKQLRAMEVKNVLNPKAIFLLAQKGDETIDYRQAVEKYQGCQRMIQEGGSHTFDNFSGVLPDIFSFLADRVI